MSWLSKLKDVLRGVLRSPPAREIVFTELLALINANPIVHAAFADGPPQDTFLPGYPEHERQFLWELRNPFRGLADAVAIEEPYTTEGTTVSPDYPHGLTWLPDKKEGSNWLLHTLPNGKQYPFFSYRGAGVEFATGWKPSGHPVVDLRKEFAGDETTAKPPF